ncbi:MAG: type II secretion system protein [bacterium]
MAELKSIRKSKYLDQAGQSLIEVMMVILLVSVFLTAFASLAVDMVRKLTFSKKQLEAKALLDNDLEDARSDRDNLGWEVFLLSDPCGTPVTSDHFTVERSCDIDASSNYAEIKTVVSWPGQGGATNSVSALTILSNDNLW